MPRINPDIMIWARESAGLSLEEAARAIGLSGLNAVARLTEMEAGERDPTRRQLVAMSKKYRRPLLTFYLSGPPEPGRRTHDFRTLPIREAGSEAVLDALIRDVKARQALVRTALEDAEEDEVLPFVGSIGIEQGSETLAAAIRGTLQFDLREYRAARSIDDAFRVLRGAVEQAGMFVILMGNLGHHTTNLSPRVFRGFTIADPVAPFVVVNETDSRSAWSFTLLHEVAHVFLGESGISGYDSDERLERLCDEVAARLLLDQDELRAVRVRGADIQELIRDIGDFAAERKVSRKMVAYNLLRAGLLTGERYGELSARFDADRMEYAQRVEGGAVDYYVVRRHRVGSGLLRLVDRMVAAGALTTTKAGKVLGVRPTAVGRMTEVIRAA